MKCTKILINLWRSWRMGKPPWSFDLQRFAGEKTEDPTAKRKSEARDKGQVPKSMDFNSAIVLLGAFFSLKFIGPYMYEQLAGLMKNVFTHFPTTDFTIQSFQEFFLSYGMVFLLASLPLMVIILIISLCINYAQVGFLFTLEPLTPSLDKLNPINGFQRMFSVQSLVELVKSIFKVAIVSFFIYQFAEDQVAELPNLMTVDLLDSLKKVCSLSLDLAFRIITVLLVLAILDYAYQIWQNNKNLKMSKDEVKEEMKQSEGDPQIKGKIRSKQREMAMKRMMQEVPKATVVVTNPTHFAVALKYDPTLAAPIVVAKGQDYLAFRIKAIARENSVVIVENRPLARALYSSAEIGEMIPAELYQAVAEVLAYVYRLKKKLS